MLCLEDGTYNQLYYNVSGLIHNAFTMLPEPTRNVSNLIPIINMNTVEAELSSAPIFIKTTNGAGVFVTNGNHLSLLPTDLCDIDYDDFIIAVSVLHVPGNINLSRPNRRYLRLLEQAPENESTLNEILDEVNPVQDALNSLSYNLNAEDSEDSENAEDSESIEDLKNTLSALIRQLYGLAVETPTTLEVNGLPASFVSFEQAQRLVVIKTVIDPLHQPWAGPPGTDNRIVTLILEDGRIYLVKARYQHGRMLPPI